MRRSASMLAISLKLSLISSLLLTGIAQAAQEPRLEASIAINQFEDDLLPNLENEVQTLVTGSNNNNNDAAIDVEALQRKRFLLIQAAFAAAVGVSAIALAYGVRSYSKYHQW